MEFSRITKFDFPPSDTVLLFLETGDLICTNLKFIKKVFLFSMFEGFWAKNSKFF